VSWASRASKIAVGDRVAFKASFLRNTGQQTGETPFMRGEVTELKPLGDNVLATVKWSEDYTSRVLIGNLSKVTARGIADE
jgi:hypothetical protein